ncbi:NAD/NADP octopine/nopaline dehydrogenase family protein [Clostridium sp. FAM 1755]|uniref:NAD/NADP-dependent octopine/nopaline dehydrogenase family protein n=1 Tax=Clostridium caseinilyticum TaxID=3350403 RepID=UPI0038F80A0A
MNITIIGAGNSGLAMAAHLGSQGNKITLWNRTGKNISKLMNTHIIKSRGIINGNIKIDVVTTDMERAVSNSDIILVTTPANSHKDIAIKIAQYLCKSTLIVLNPGRTFGALEFLEIVKKSNKKIKPCIAETQTIMYTCRKTGENSVNIIALKSDVLISTFNPKKNKSIISKLPECLRKYFIPAKSIIETSIGNVGMILHCAPLLLNSGWTESKSNSYKYYYDAITPSIGTLLEKIDKERVLVSEKLGFKVESTKNWLKRTYNVQGDSIYECIQNNGAYKTIDAPSSLSHRYILEDIPCGLVPLESIGKISGLSMKYTTMIIDLASAILNIDFRQNGRNIEKFIYVKEEMKKYLYDFEEMKLEKVKKNE